MSVSVITPNFNNAPYLQRCLAPLLRDRGVGEIVIYDNASTDRSLEVVASFENQKIRVIRGASNLGATSGRHQAIMESQFDHICFVDGDDFLAEDSIGDALDSLRQTDLDIALFDMFKVDASGNCPELFIPAPTTPIDGRSACAMTLGGWRIHCSGVLKKEVYERGWSGFQSTGFSDDELLTRRILLAARRVGGSPGKIFYRQIPKALDAARLHGSMTTAVNVLALAHAAGLPEPDVRRQRNMVVRALIGMTRRRVGNAEGRAALSIYLRYYDAIRVPWRRPDWPYRIMHQMLLVLRR